MEMHPDGDRESVRQARAGEPTRPAGADAAPRIGPRPGERGPITPGLGAAPTGVPTTTDAPEPASMPPGSEPGKAAAWAIIGAVILALGLVALPFFVFSIVVALPVALVFLVIAAVLVAGSRKRPRSGR